jgi:type IV secretion system protein VirD4
MRFNRALLILAVLLAAYAVGLLFIALWPGSLIVFPVALLWKRKIWWSGAHGTARWATADDLKGMMAAKEGLMIGRLTSPPPSLADGVRALVNRRIAAPEAVQTFLQAWRKKPVTGMVRLSKAVHVAAFAPTGVGKGVSIVLPFLLNCRDSCVVVDFKGELAKLTAEHRRKLGHRIVILDPYRVVTPRPDTFNPLDWIDQDAATAIDECADLADALVIRTGQEKDPHFNDTAEEWLTAMTALVVSLNQTGARSIQTVRSLLTDADQMAAAIRSMRESTAWGGLLQRAGNKLSQFVDREKASVLTTVNRHMRFLDTPAIQECTGTSSFDPAELNTGRMTVYLVLPPDHMRSQSALLRMWIGAMIRAVVKGGLGEHRKVHFVLDEAASLGKMDQIEDALDKYRGYGIRLLLLYQSMGQLKKCWPDGADQTLLSNVSQVFFGVNDHQTAEYVSNRLGEHTIAVASGGSSTGGSLQTSDVNPGTSTSASWNSNENWNQVGRKLLRPEEVMGLDTRTAITFCPGTPPIATTLIRYFEEQLGKAPFWPALRTALRSVKLCLMATVMAGAVTMAVERKWSKPDVPASPRGW